MASHVVTFAVQFMLGSTGIDRECKEYACMQAHGMRALITSSNNYLANLITPWQLNYHLIVMIYQG
jgi:hypothetical protein